MMRPGLWVLSAPFGAGKTTRAARSPLRRKKPGGGLTA